MKKKKLYYIAGIIAEYIACLILILKLYRIIKLRYKSHFGEIDIICISPSGELCFIEVKKRNNFSEETLSLNKISRIKKTAECFLSKNVKFTDKNMRFDYIILNKIFFVKHYKNYFQ